MNAKVDTATEVVVYRIKTGRTADFRKVRARVRQELGRFEGLVDLTTRQLIQDPNVFCDVCRWATKADALRAFQNFSELPSAAAFLATFEGRPRYLGHFGPAL